MSQNLNADFIPKITNCIDAIEDVVKPNIMKGLESNIEMAKATGSEKFMKSAEALDAGVSELLKAADNLLEILTNVRNQYQKINEALN